MPNYTYKCNKCEATHTVTLPMSTDPKQLRDCAECDGKCKRIIVSGAVVPKVVGKVWAGDWFKKTYGHDMFEGADRMVSERRDYEREKKNLEKDGVRITHKSRQVGGKDRISIPDKKDD